jgi:two-component system sensor histidine kinase YesM
MVTVSEEMRVAGIYLDIQKHRFEDRLKVEINVESEIEKARIPKYIIQPIVENSIIHGLRDKMGIMKISIHGFKEGNDLFIEISDNGKGIPEDKIRKIFEEDDISGSKTNSIGIRNVIKRIKLYYGPEYGLIIESSKDTGTKITLRMQNSGIIQPW